MAALILLLSCSAGGGCNDMGSESRISINFYGVSREHAGEQLALEACVDDFCKKTTYDGDSHPSVDFGDDVVNSDAKRLVSLAIADADGNSLFSGTSEVTPAKQQVNGKGCPPTTYGASLRTSGPDTLMIADSVNN